MTRYTLGISSYYHDSAAALVRDGVPIAAVPQEPFSRRKQDPRFPADAVRYCLSEAEITLDDLSCVAYYENPSVKFRRTLSSFASAGYGGMSAFSRIAPEWLSWKRDALLLIDKELAQLDLGKAPKAI